jgi:hypothetical protein
MGVGLLLAAVLSGVGGHMHTAHGYVASIAAAAESQLWLSTVRKFMIL